MVKKIICFDYRFSNRRLVVLLIMFVMKETMQETKPVILNGFMRIDFRPCDIIIFIKYTNFIIHIRNKLFFYYNIYFILFL